MKKPDMRNQYLQDMYDNYIQAAIEIGGWALHLRDMKMKGNSYRAMIGHQCPDRTWYHLRNGERNLFCTDCGEYIPDEIAGMWHLLCDDQRNGRVRDV
jgi:hypothetical protein